MVGDLCIIRAAQTALLLSVWLIQHRGTLCFYCLVEAVAGDFTHTVLCKVHRSLCLLMSQKNMCSGCFSHLS